MLAQAPVRRTASPTSRTAASMPAGNEGKIAIAILWSLTHSMVKLGACRAKLSALALSSSARYGMWTTRCIGPHKDKECVMNALETDPHVGSHLAIAVVRIGHVGHQMIAPIQPKLERLPYFVFDAHTELNAHIQVLSLIRGRADDHDVQSNRDDPGAELAVFHELDLRCHVNGDRRELCLRRTAGSRQRSHASAHSGRGKTIEL